MAVSEEPFLEKSREEKMSELLLSLILKEPQFLEYTVNNLPVEYLSVFMAATMHGLSVLAGGFGQMAAKDFVAQSKAMEDLLVAALCR